MTDPTKTDKELLAEVLAEPYDPDWRRKIAIEILDRKEALAAADFAAQVMNDLAETAATAAAKAKAGNDEIEATLSQLRKQEGTTE